MSEDGEKLKLETPAPADRGQLACVAADLSAERGGLAAAVDDAALGQVVRGHFHGDWSPVRMRM